MQIASFTLLGSAHLPSHLQLIPTHPNSSQLIPTLPTHLLIPIAFSSGSGDEDEEDEALRRAKAESLRTAEPAPPPKVDYASR